MNGRRVVELIKSINIHVAIIKTVLMLRSICCEFIGFRLKQTEDILQLEIYLFLDQSFNIIIQNRRDDGPHLKLVGVSVMHVLTITVKTSFWSMAKRQCKVMP